MLALHPEHDERIASRDPQVLRGPAGKRPRLSSSSEYIRELIRKDQDRQRLRGLLLKGAVSSPAVTADADYFGRLRDRVGEAASGELESLDD